MDLLRQLIQDCCSYLKRENWRIVSDATVRATQKKSNKTSQLSTLFHTRL